MFYNILSCVFIRAALFIKFKLYNWNSSAYTTHNVPYFLEDLGLVAVLGRLAFAGLPVLGLMASSAPSAVYAKYTCDRSISPCWKKALRALHTM